MKIEKKERVLPRMQYIGVLLMIVMGVFAGCSKDSDDGTEPGGGTFPEGKYPMTFTVTDGGYASSDASQGGGYPTTFTAGDQIGLYVVKADGTILRNNVCLTYDGTEWAGEAYWGGAGAKYFAYSPWQAIPSGTPVATATDAAVFFAGMISAWTPASDQSTHAAYSASDLMIGSGSIGAKIGYSYPLAFTMKHAQALVVIELPTIKYTLATDEKYTWTAEAATATKFNGFTPYRLDGTYRYLVKPAQTGTELSGSYTDARGLTNEYTLNANIAAANYVHYKVDGGITATKTYTLQEGDFYLKDGSLVGKDVPLTDVQQAACIGLVFQTDPSRIGAGEKAALAAKGVAAPHGLVMALTNASEGCWWGDRGNNEPNPFSDIVYANQMYKDLDGYNKTKTMVDKITAGDYDATTYAAFNAASKYGTGGSAQFTAPTSSTGWFLPGMGQWWDILVNLGGVSVLNNHQNSTESNFFLPNTSQTAVDHLNVWLGRVPGAVPFVMATYWSGSESNGSDACLVSFSDYRGDLRLGWGNKYNSSNRSKVRCVLAF